MSFLNEINSEHLAARITNKGRKKIAQGDFNIHYFQLGDSEFDYAFSEFDGTSTRPAQKVFTPLDKDNQVKYPYKISESSLTGTTFGNPIQVSQTETIRNVMGPAGYVSNYIEYDSELCEGTTVECGWEQIDINKVNGTSSLVIPSGTTFNNCKFITIFFDNLLCSNDTISDDASSLVYRIVSLTTGSTTNTLTLDRPMPNYSSLSPKDITVICNECTPQYPGPHDEAKVCLPIPPTPEDQQDPWIQNIVWSKKPAGMDEGVQSYTSNSSGLVQQSNSTDESLSGYTSNVFVSTKEFFGYNTSSGQTSNTGTTITNSFGDTVIVLPEEQKCISVIHYSKVGDILRDPDLGFKYEDYISTNHIIEDSLVDDIFGDPLTDLEYFEIYIPFIYYHRTTGTTVGARFFMGTTDMSINSTAIDTKLDQMKYRYLIDEDGHNVGKVFYNHKVIIFDDEEIVAALDYKSNRRYTLPAPRIAMVPTDTKCGEDGEPLTPLMTGTTGQTIFVTYILEYTPDTRLNGLHCNYYTKLTGTTTPGDVSIKFSENEFRHMVTTTGTTKGFYANKFQILAQKVNTGSQPEPNNWRIIDFTSEIPGHTVGNIINPVNLRNKRFVISNSDYENAGRYDLENYLQPLIGFPNEAPSGTTISNTIIYSGGTHNLYEPQFGDEQPFTGSIRLVRAIDLEVMRFLINLPSGEFTTTQNPSFITGKQKRITEVALLNENKEVLVIAKVPKPIVRTGTQVFAVKIDI